MDETSKAGYNTDNPRFTDESNISNITVTLSGGIEMNIPIGTPLLEIAANFQKNYRSLIVAAKVNNDIKELSYLLHDNCRVDFLDLTDEDGMRIYRRSLYFIFIKAVAELFPERKAVLGHSIIKGVYCEINGTVELTADEVMTIESRMKEIVEKKIPFVKHIMPIEDSKELFRRNGRMDRFHAIEHRTKPYATIYSCDEFEDYFYGYMVPDTSYVKTFALKYYPPGIVIRFPEKSNPTVLPKFTDQKKLFAIFLEYKRWGHILGFDNVGDLNDAVESGKENDLIRVSEALHEKKIAQIADMITGSSEKKQIVLISGPSSSGKTTFAHRLEIQLRVNGVMPLTISLDDYFVDRDRTPVDEKGEFDFEALEAIDVSLFNNHLSELINGREVEIPVFNFAKGSRETVGRKLRLNENNVLIIEGIHGLNEKLTASISRNNKFKIYVSALTSLNIDDHNRIPSTDTRLIRRIVRDNQFRGSSAVSTIKRWPSVGRGEETNIFPFQEEADIMFNSSLVYELGVLKTQAEALLAEVDRSVPEYSEARRLIEFLSYFLPISACGIPANSIIREFVGDSCFY